MTRNVRYIGLAAAGICLVSGWAFARLDSSTEIADRDIWDGSGSALSAPTDYAAIAQRIKASGLFPQGRKTQTSEDETQTQAEPEPANRKPDFPDIVGQSTVDGTPLFSFITDNNEVQSARAGDRLASGWTIKSIDTDRIVATYEETEESFPILNYHKGQAPAVVSDTAEKAKDL